MKYQLNENELEDHLKSQIRFIENSQQSFGKGFHEEAQRLATTMRILLHNKKSSHSLLKQLNKDNMNFVSTTPRFIPVNMISYTGFLNMRMSGDKASYELNDIVDEIGNLKLLKFDDWWNELIIYDKKQLFSRKDIILTVANKDGGAHIDSKLNKEYADLIKKNSLGWIYSNQENEEGQELENNVAYLSIRKISEELILSFKLSKLAIGMNKVDEHYKILDLIGENKYYTARFLVQERPSLDESQRIIHNKIFNNIDNIKGYTLNKEYKKQRYNLVFETSNNESEELLLVFNMEVPQDFDEKILFQLPLIM